MEDKPGAGGTGKEQSYYVVHWGTEAKAGLDHHQCMELSFVLQEEEDEEDG